MRMKKVWCMMLSALMVLCTVSWTTAVFAQDKAYVMFNMESDDKRPAYSGSGSYSGSIVTDVADKGKVMRIAPGVAAPTSANNKISIPIALDTAVSEKIVVSYDVKSVGGSGAGYLLVTATDSNGKSYMMARMGSTTTGSWLFNNWETKAEANPVGVDRWSRVDIVLDLKAQAAELYKDGKLISSGNKTSSFATLQDVKSIVLDCYVATAPDDKGVYKTEEFLLDNLTVSDAAMLTTGQSGTVLGENGEVYITLPSTISTNCVLPETAVLTRVGTTDEIACSVSLVNGTICLTPAEGFEVAAEYEVTFPENTEITNFLGMTLDTKVVFETPGEITEVLLESEDFSGGSLPAKFEASNDSGEVVANDGKISVTADGELKITPFAWRCGAKYTLPNNMPESYTLKLSYRARAEKSAGGQAGGYFIQIGSSYNTGESMGLAMNYNEAATAGAIIYPNNGKWWSTNRVILVPADKVDEEEWYTYEYEYEINGRTRPSATYRVKDKNGAVLGQVSGITTSGESFITPRYIRFEYIRPTDKGGAAYYDDIEISYSYFPNYVKRARIDGLLGEKIVPSINPSNAMTGMTLTFANPPTAVEATLRGPEGESQPVATMSGADCTIKWDSFLTNGEYTLIVDYGEMQPYVYYFVPRVEEKPIIADFDIYKNGIKAASLSEVGAGDMVTVKAKVFNTTGQSLSGCVSYAVYDGLVLKAMNFDEKPLSESITGTELSKSFSGSLLGTSPKIRAFLWDKIDSLGFMTEPIEIN